MYLTYENRAKAILVSVFMVAHADRRSLHVYVFCSLLTEMPETVSFEHKKIFSIIFSSVNT